MLGKQGKKKKQLSSYAQYSSLVLQMACIIALGAFLGDYLDAKNYIKTPIYTIVFSLAAIFFALYYVFNKIKKL